MFARSTLSAVLFAGVACAQPVDATTAAPAQPFAKWEKAIAGREAEQTANPPKPGGTVFSGSSSIVKWNLAESFPDANVTNSGFGGSQIRENTHFAPRIVLPLKPSTIVFYAGDNDVNAKRTPEQVRDDFIAYVAAIHAELPKCRILFVAIKPSLKRWSQRETQAEANAMVEKVCAGDDRLTYVDIVTPMFGEDGTPMPELFVKDGLHMSKAGYEIWTKIITPLLPLSK